MSEKILIKQPMVVFLVLNILVFSFLNVVGLCLTKIYV